MFPYSHTAGATLFSNRASDGKMHRNYEGCIYAVSNIYRVANKKKVSDSNTPQASGKESNTHQHAYFSTFYSFT